MPVGRGGGGEGHGTPSRPHTFNPTAEPMAILYSPQFRSHQEDHEGCLSNSMIYIHDLLETSPSLL